METHDNGIKRVNICVLQYDSYKHLLEKEMETHSSIFAWRIPWTEESGSLQSMGSQESDTTKWLSTHTKYS